MTKEQELMSFLHAKVFDPILDSKEASQEVKSGVNLTIGRMNRLNAEKMIHYFWASLVTENAIIFSKKKRIEGLPRFEDILEDFRDKFNDRWLKN